MPARRYAASVVEQGQQAPDFTLESDDGEHVSLSQFRGKPVSVLYFYPRDDSSTSGS